MQRMIRFVLLCLAAVVTAHGPAHAAAERADGKPRIAVISAFAPELAALTAATEGARTRTINGITFTLGRLAGQDVVLFLSGVSMVNAAANTQLVLDRFDVTRIVFSGIAGGVNPALHIGDVVVPEQWGQYLQADFARRVGKGYELPNGDKKVFANFGFVFPQPTEIVTAARPEPTKRFWFKVDPAMLATARSIRTRVEGRFQRCTAQKACLRDAPRLAVGGNGVSGMAFVDNKAFRTYTFRTFKANVLDEESAAVASVATANATPFLVFRSLSDLAGGGPGQNEEATFFQLAADNSAAAVTAFLKAWRPN